MVTDLTLFVDGSTDLTTAAVGNVLSFSFTYTHAGRVIEDATNRSVEFRRDSVAVSVYSGAQTYEFTEDDIGADFELALIVQDQDGNTSDEVVATIPNPIAGSAGHTLAKFQNTAFWRGDLTKEGAPFNERFNDDDNEVRLIKNLSGSEENLICYDPSRAMEYNSASNGYCTPILTGTIAWYLQKGFDLSGGEWTYFFKLEVNADLTNLLDGFMSSRYIRYQSAFTRFTAFGTNPGAGGAPTGEFISLGFRCSDTLFERLSDTTEVKAELAYYRSGSPDNLTSRTNGINIHDSSDFNNFGINSGDIRMILNQAKLKYFEFHNFAMSKTDFALQLDTLQDK